MTGKKHLLHSIHHLLIAGILILKGYDKYSHHNIIGGLMLFFGIIVLLYFIYMIFKKNESRTMNIVIHLFEALVSLFTAYIFFEEGKKYLQYMCLLASLGFFIAVYVSFTRRKKGNIAHIN